MYEIWISAFSTARILYYISFYISFYRSFHISSYILIYIWIVDGRIIEHGSMLKTKFRSNCALHSPSAILYITYVRIRIPLGLGISRYRIDGRTFWYGNVATSNRSQKLLQIRTAFTNFQVCVVPKYPHHTQPIYSMNNIFYYLSSPTLFPITAWVFTTFLTT